MLFSLIAFVLVWYIYCKLNISMDIQDFINTCTENDNLNNSFYDYLNKDRDLEFLPGIFWN